MKNRIYFFGLIGLMVGAFTMSCENTSEQKVENAEGNIDSAAEEVKNAQTQYVVKWRRFKRAAELTIKINENRIDAFKQKMDYAGHTFKAKNCNEAALLEQRNRDLKKKLREYRDEGQITREQFRTNFNYDMDRVGRSMTVLFKDDR